MYCQCFLPRFLSFSFDSPGMVFATEHCAAEATELHLLHKANVQPPREGVSCVTSPWTRHSQVEISSLRELCSDEAQDISCPPPNSTTAQNKTLFTLFIDSRLHLPSCIGHYRTKHWTVNNVLFALLFAIHYCTYTPDFLL